MRPNALIPKQKLENDWQEHCEKIKLTAVSRQKQRVYTDSRSIQEDSTTIQNHPTTLNCNIPDFDPDALSIHDIYIVNNHGVELKAKSPPSIWLCYVSVIRTVTDGISGYVAYILSYGIM